MFSSTKSFASCEYFAILRKASHRQPREIASKTSCDRMVSERSVRRVALAPQFNKKIPKNSTQVVREKRTIPRIITMLQRLVRVTLAWASPLFWLRIAGILKLSSQ